RDERIGVTRSRRRNDFSGNEVVVHAEPGDGAAERDGNQEGDERLRRPPIPGPTTPPYGAVLRPRGCGPVTAPLPAAPRLGQPHRGPRPRARTNACGRRGRAPSS